MDESNKSPFKYWNQLIIEKYILILASIQILLLIVILISYFYKLMFNKEIPIIERIREKKDTINFYFILFTSLLIIYIFNPYINVSFVMSDNLKSVLFSAAFVQLLFLLQKEPSIYKNFDAIKSIIA